MIELRVLGGIELRRIAQGRKRTLRLQPKPFALLVYLALESPSRLHRRDALVGIFWAELDQTHARRALRKALHHLRRSLGADTVLSVGDEEVGLAPGAIWCDAVAFQEACRAGRPVEAVDLYRGELLPGFFSHQAAGFEDWLELSRGRLRQLALEAAWTLADEDQRRGDPVGAAHWAQEAVGFAPYDEGSVRRLLRLLWALGDRAGAIRAYEALRKRYADLDLEPSPESQALVEQIREPPDSTGGGHRDVTAGDPRALDSGRAPGAVGKALPVGAREPAGSRKPQPLGTSRFRDATRSRRVRAGTALALAALAAGGWLVLGPGGPRSFPANLPRLVILLKGSGGAQADPYVVQGVREGISRRLVGMAGLKLVRGRGGDGTKAQGRVRRALDADLVLELRVGGEGPGSAEGVQLEARLVQGPGGGLRWRGSFTAPTLESLFQAEAAIAGRAIQELGATLNESDQRALQARPTHVPRAYDHFLRGSRALRQGTGAGDYRIAAESFQRAIELDPSFALAYAQLSRAHTRVHGSGGDPGGEHRTLAGEAAKRALALDPELSEAHFALGLHHYYGFRDYDRGLEAFENALRRAPNDPEVHFHMGRALHQSGRIERGIRSREQALELDPQAPEYRIDLAWAYSLIGRYAEAHRLYDGVMEYAPGLTATYEAKARTFQLQGELGEAANVLQLGIERTGLVRVLNRMEDPYNTLLLNPEAQARVNRLRLAAGVRDTARLYLQKAFVHWSRARTARRTALFDSAAYFGRLHVKAHPEDHWGRLNLAMALAGAGRRRVAIAEAIRAVAQLPTSRDRRWGPDMVMVLGIVYMMLGEHDTAIENFERTLAAALHPAAYRRYFRHHPLFEPVRDHPRFEELVGA